ncbi:hypothetical protein HDU96_005573 [Phlyctochytrium bullatum]|nr:hypothetical protein HDU96_005573 [Phlyctochytrium bullatum]
MDARRDSLDSDFRCGGGILHNRPRRSIFAYTSDLAGAIPLGGKGKSHQSPAAVAVTFLPSSLSSPALAESQQAKAAGKKKGKKSKNKGRKKKAKQNAGDAQDVDPEVNNTLLRLMAMGIGSNTLDYPAGGAYSGTHSNAHGLDDYYGEEDLIDEDSDGGYFYVGEEEY